MTQEQQVIDVLRAQGGFATLRRLNEVIDFSTWKTKTPEASVRRIVQNSDAIFRIQPGLWALEESREEVLGKFKIKNGSPKSVEMFNHAYYQGLLVEIGRCRNSSTYVPPQDQHRLFLDKKLGDLIDYKTIPKFTFETLLRKARTVDVIWFNERNMPTHFYEIEHTTDIKNSLSKFYELQDFFSSFHIVANSYRENEFNDKINASIFSPIKSRVVFITYDKVASLHSNLSQQKLLIW
ncbi:hypothetical protein [Muribaculum intestinale]|uniref:hypothetical protein n=1 Tax=Muribaculum intestinale TaxID=1796646 RepID=UPI0025A9CCCC|nr:hypothetical protein [Muribaculum intestinale]